MANRTKYEYGQDLLSPNRNFAPLTSEVDERGMLNIGGCRLSSLATDYGTPLYVLDETTIRAACRSYRESLAKHYPGPSLALYASKANSSLAISSIVKSEGMGIDVVSEGELITALKANVPPNKIFLHGNNKSDQELLVAYRNGIKIVIDNHHDIDRLAELVKPGQRPAELMLRFTPGIECHTHEYIRTGHLDSKFGFDPEQLKSVLLKLKEASWAKLSGLHAHIGSQIFELEPHKDLTGVMVDALILAREIGHPIEDLNLGGGLGIRYVESDDPPSIEEWVEVISNGVKEACQSKDIELPRLICEPGRSLIANAGITIYRLGSRKEIPGLRTYVSVDGGMSDNPRPITYQSSYSACLVDSPLDTADEKVTIAGKHCESGDILLKDLSLPFSRSGEFLAVFGTGAYNSSMGSNYNRIPRPAAVIVAGGQSELVQRREQPEDLLQYDILPDRLIELG